MKLSSSFIVCWVCAAALIPLTAAYTFPQTRTFTKVKYMVPVGDKSKPVKVHVRFTDEVIQAQNFKTGVVLKEIKYADITAATYSRSKHPRWKEALVTGLFIWPAGIAVVFMKSKKHWLAIQTSKKKDYMLLRLDKKNYHHVILALESNSDVDVARVEE